MKMLNKATGYFYAFIFQICCLKFVFMSVEEPQWSCYNSFVEKLILMEQELASQKAEINAILKRETRVLGKSVGDTYIRWGRTVCPRNGSSVLYSGYMAGPRYTHKGTGSNYICLTNEPLWDHFDTRKESLGRITGAEYRFFPHKQNGAADFLGQNMFSHNAPCAVCHTMRSVSVMIPGRNRCYDGWTKEYSGYLVSGCYSCDNSATEYVCLDRRPEKTPDGGLEDNDNRLYFVEAICGSSSLSCPPYVSGREITCVVCTI